MAHSREDLETLLADGESHLVERKASGADASTIRRNICAFANDLPATGRAGVLFVGVRDDGSCAGLPITDDLLTGLANARSGDIQPLPSIQVEKMTLRGCELAVVQVEPSLDPPVRYQGRVWVKVGPTVQLATAEEEQRLAERRRGREIPFDHRPTPATLEDLDLDYARRVYLPAAIATEVLEANQRPIDQQLRSLRLLAEGRPTWGAMLGLGRDPQAWLPGATVQFLRLAGDRLTDPILDQKLLTGRLDDVLRRLDELLEINVAVRTDVAGAKREVQRPDYPLVALQQLARNAVMHRVYDGTHAPCKVYWYSDRVDIQSPGGLYGRVTPDNIRQGATDYRNPLVAEIMHHLGFAQRFGLGIALATRALEENGNPPPELDFSPTHVVAILRPAP